jgi:hypothetical protein
MYAWRLTSEAAPQQPETRTGGGNGGSMCGIEQAMATAMAVVSRGAKWTGNGGERR